MHELFGQHFVLKNWQNNLNSVALQYCKCDLLQEVMGHHYRNLFQLVNLQLIGNVSL